MLGNQASVTVSVVSHGQRVLVDALLEDLAGCAEVAEVVITHNIPEPDCNIPAALAGRVTVLRNRVPRGFGANHNAALQGAVSPFVCILNPDIRFLDNPFPALLTCMSRYVTSLAAPQVFNPAGVVEDSARSFPTVLNLLKKALGRADGRISTIDQNPFEPDWVAGMFIVVRADVYSRLGGFDEGYFLYYEDVDFCVRVRRAGHRLVCCPGAMVIHDARRASRRQLRYMLWHGRSMLRYFIKHWGRLPKVGRS